MPLEIDICYSYTASLPHSNSVRIQWQPKCMSLVLHMIGWMLSMASQVERQTRKKACSCSVGAVFCLSFRCPVLPFPLVLPVPFPSPVSFAFLFTVPLPLPLPFTVLVLVLHVGWAAQGGHQVPAGRLGRLLA